MVFEPFKRLHTAEEYSGTGACAHFHWRVGFLTGTHAIQEVLNVAFDRDRRFHLLDGLRILEPWFLPDSESGGIENHRALVALELHGPVVVVRVAVVQGP